MSKSLKYSAAPVFVITSVVWIMGVSNHRFLASEFWIYVGMFLIPATAVCGCIWLISHGPVWRRILGSVLLVPSMGTWVLSLLLVFHGFRIH